MIRSNSSAAAMILFLVCVAGRLGAETITVQRVLVTLTDQVDVPARQRGQLINFTAQEGETVEAGSLLAQIDDADARLVLQRAAIGFENSRQEAENTIKVRLAKKSIELAESELERGITSRRLFQNSVTEEELRRRRLVLESAQLDLEQAEHDFELAQHQVRFSKTELSIAERALDLYRIVAPIDGIVSKVLHRQGEWVEPGDTVARIVRIDRLRAECFLNADRIQGTLDDSPVTLHVELPGVGTREFQGRLQFVSREVNPVDGMIRLWAAIENPDQLLLPGMQATMSIHISDD